MYHQPEMPAVYQPAMPAVYQPAMPAIYQPAMPTIHQQCFVESNNQGEQLVPDMPNNTDLIVANIGFHKEHASSSSIKLELKPYLQADTIIDALNFLCNLKSFSTSTTNDDDAQAIKDLKLYISVIRNLQDARNVVDKDDVSAKFFKELDEVSISDTGENDAKFSSVELIFAIVMIKIFCYKEVNFRKTPSLLSKLGKPDLEDQKELNINILNLMFSVSDSVTKELTMNNFLDHLYLLYDFYTKKFNQNNKSLLKYKVIYSCDNCLKTVITRVIRDGYVIIANSNSQGKDIKNLQKYINLLLRAKIIID